MNTPTLEQLQAEIYALKVRVEEMQPHRVRLHQEMRAQIEAEAPKIIRAAFGIRDESTSVMSIGTALPALRAAVSESVAQIIQGSIGSASDWEPA